MADLKLQRLLNALSPKTKTTQNPLLRVLLLENLGVLDVLAVTSISLKVCAYSFCTLLPKEKAAARN